MTCVENNDASWMVRMKVSKFSRFALYSTLWYEKSSKILVQMCDVWRWSSWLYISSVQNEMDIMAPWSAIGGSDKNAQGDSKTILRFRQKQ